MVSPLNEYDANIIFLLTLSDAIASVKINHQCNKNELLVLSVRTLQTDLLWEMNNSLFSLSSFNTFLSGAHPANFKGGGLKKTSIRTQERIQKILVGGRKF